MLKKLGNVGLVFGGIVLASGLSTVLLMALFSLIVACLDQSVFSHAFDLFHTLLSRRGGKIFIMLTVTVCMAFLRDLGCKSDAAPSK